MGLENKAEAENTGELRCSSCGGPSRRPEDSPMPEGFGYVPEDICVGCLQEFYSPEQSKLERGMHERYFNRKNHLNQNI